MNSLPRQSREACAANDDSMRPRFVVVIFGGGGQWECHRNKSGEAAKARSHQEEQAYTSYPDAQYGGHAGADQAIVKRTASPAGEQVEERRIVIGAVKNRLLQVVEGR